MLDRCTQYIPPNLISHNRDLITEATRAPFITPARSSRAAALLFIHPVSFAATAAASLPLTILKKISAADWNFTPLSSLFLSLSPLSRAVSSFSLSFHPQALYLLLHRRRLRFSLTSSATVVERSLYTFCLPPGNGKMAFCPLANGSSRASLSLRYFLFFFFFLSSREGEGCVFSPVFLLSRPSLLREYFAKVEKGGGGGGGGGRLSRD